MKAYRLIWSLTVVLILAASSMTYSQSFIKKVKKKAEEKVIEKAFGEEENQSNQEQNQYQYYDEADESSSTLNKRGSGLVSTPPDVLANITSAHENLKIKEFGKTRSSIRQALIGVEMEIGHRVLDDLPSQISELDIVEDSDRVVSSGIGFEGLVIERVYRGEDQEFKLSIGNDAALLTAMNMFMGEDYYEESENRKQVDYKGYRSVIEYDDSKGYTLSVPFGQSSIIVMNGVNFSDEEELMQAANFIDIEKIKEQLGEQ
ncbi:MAG: hypothetical protein ACLFNL_09560 [Bacteroidales bacterium]